MQGHYTLNNNKVNKIADYLEKKYSKEEKIYTEFDDGSYMEYRGFLVYMDSRAEVFIKKFNHKEDIFKEYSLVLNGSIDYQKFLDKYSFQYLIVDEGSPFYQYLVQDNKYRLEYQQKDKVLFVVGEVYEKKD